MSQRRKGGLFMPKDIAIKLSDGRTVSRKDYIRAKTKDLIEFGYSDLTEEEVEHQLTKIEGKETFLNSLSVIGLFIQDDICKE